MCCLYGFLHYGGNEIKHIRDITNELSKEAAQRGTDATGIAFNDNGGLNITKDGKSAYRINFKHPDRIGNILP